MENEIAQNKELTKKKKQQQQINQLLENLRSQKYTHLLYVILGVLI